MSGRSPRVDFTDQTILDQITSWIASGYTEASIAKQLGYSPTHFCGIKKKNPQLAEAIKDGRHCVEQLVHDKLFKMMMDDSHSKQFSALVFYAKCQLGWNDKGSEVQYVEKTTGLSFKPIQAQNDTSDD